MPSFGTPFESINLDRKLNKEELLRGLRFVTAAEFEAVALYQQLAEASGDKDVKKVLLDVANEELVHAGEFMALIKKLSPEEEKFYKDGEKETAETIKKSFDFFKVIKACDSLSGRIEKDYPKTALKLDQISDLLEKDLI